MGKLVLFLVLPLSFWLVRDLLKEDDISHNRAYQYRELDSLALELDKLEKKMNNNRERSRDLAEVIIQSRFLEIDLHCSQEAVASLEKKQVLTEINACIALLD
ncbi:MAG TPA: hypothetical protein PKD96_03705 [Candidatus Absconditabacterales bacterium]|nr:hypothetical protein [Candidatus Absconditabacterales bacterium]HMT27385.1 hypothetical protein [Candidatus Absconditabacterales bacterium]